jgi:hypothetical protein
MRERHTSKYVAHSHNFRAVGGPSVMIVTGITDIRKPNGPNSLRIARRHEANEERQLRALAYLLSLPLGVEDDRSGNAASSVVGNLEDAASCGVDVSLRAQDGAQARVMQDAA